MRKEILKAIRCCREGRCTDCPMIGTICDDMRIDVVDLPGELVDLIEEQLEE